jgi:hypothetical protein
MLLQHITGDFADILKEYLLKQQWYELIIIQYSRIILLDHSLDAALICHVRPFPWGSFNMPYNCIFLWCGANINKTRKK